MKKKKKKRKLSLKKIFKFLVILIIFCFGIKYLIKIPIKNIYISGNNIISDKEILSLANIDSSSFIFSSSRKIKKQLLDNDYIKDIKIEKKLDFTMHITISEYKIICVDKQNNLYLENSKIISNNYNLSYLPILNNKINDLSSFINKFKLIDDNILLKISEIEYSPVEVDKERYLLKMNDGNYVYITLSKIKRLNKYDSIYDELDGKKGIIYLDSGNYVEIK